MGLLLWSVFSQAQAAWTVNMAPGATEVSHAVFDLHMTIFWICVVIGIIVFGAMFWSMIVHRRSTGQVAAKFHESTTVEILWTVVPLLILVAMAIPATKTLINIYDSSESDIDIQVTGYQWKWHYKYLGQDVGNGGVCRNQRLAEMLDIQIVYFFHQSVGQVGLVQQAVEAFMGRQDRRRL